MSAGLTQPIWSLALMTLIKNLGRHNYSPMGSRERHMALVGPRRRGGGETQQTDEEQHQLGRDDSTQESSREAPKAR
jgi:hypothetical protein